MDRPRLIRHTRILKGCFMRRLSLAAVLVLAALLASLTGCSARHVDWENKGAPAGAGFNTKQLDFEGSKQNYTVFIPWNYSPQKKYPVIMFLHGVLEGGSDGKKCVT